MNRVASIFQAVTISVILIAAGSARADAVLVDETLLQPCVSADCGVTGGTFTARGWEVTGPDDRIKVTLPEGADSGIAEIDVTTFYPPLNGQQGTASENYCVIFSGFEGPHFDHGGAIDESLYEIISVWCDYETVETECTHSFRERSLKLGAVGSDNAGGSSWISSGGQDKEFGWDVKETPDPVYHLRVEWDLAGVTLTVEKVGTAESGTAYREWHFIAGNPGPALRYFFLGQNDSPCDPIMQATYANLKVTKRDVQVPDGGTQTDTGPEDAGAPDTGEKDTGPADAGPSDGGVPDDTGVGTDAGQPKDSGTLADTQEPADAQAPADSGKPAVVSDGASAKSDAGEGDYGIGCGCATLHVE